MPVKEYRFHDLTLGKEVVQTPYEVQDFVIRKGDGMPTYHFGVVVDDAEMGVTHVLRGLEHLLNTVNHIALQEALGYPRPIYAHLSVMLDAGDRREAEQAGPRQPDPQAGAGVDADDQADGRRRWPSGPAVGVARLAEWLANRHRCSWT